MFSVIRCLKVDTAKMQMRLTPSVLRTRFKDKVKIYKLSNISMAYKAMKKSIMGRLWEHFPKVSMNWSGNAEEYQRTLSFSKSIHICLNVCWFSDFIFYFCMFACICYGPADLLINRDINSNTFVVGMIIKIKPKVSGYPFRKLYDSTPDGQKKCWETISIK